MRVSGVKASGCGPLVNGISFLTKEGPDSSHSSVTREQSEKITVCEPGSRTSPSTASVHLGPLHLGLVSF